MTIKMRYATRVFVLFIPITVLMTGCAESKIDETEIARMPEQGQLCQTFTALSGQLDVKDPAASLSTPAPTQLPFVQGNTPRLGAGLEAIKVEPAPTGNSVIFSFAGDGTIAWSARVVQSPLQYDTNAPVEVAGSCVLQVDLTGVLPYDEAESTQPTRSSPIGDASGIIEVITFPNRQGISQSFVGMRSDSPIIAVDSAAGPFEIAFAVSQS